MMANLNTRVIFEVCLIFISFALVKSEFTCPPDIVLRAMTCRSFAVWLLDGRFKNPPKAQWQCCNALEGLDGQVAAVCLCTVISWEASKRNYKNTNSSLASAFKTCQIEEPVGYQCLFSHYRKLNS